MFRNLSVRFHVFRSFSDLFGNDRNELLSISWFLALLGLEHILRFVEFLWEMLVPGAT